MEAQVVGIKNSVKQDWRVMCESIPFTWGAVNYTSPTRCEERVSDSKSIPPPGHKADT